jgi:hypothetical protein
MLSLSNERSGKCLSNEVAAVVPTWLVTQQPPQLAEFTLPRYNGKLLAT